MMKAWQANMDIQYVLNAYACMMYLAGYMMKNERAMGQLLKRISSTWWRISCATKIIGETFLTHQEVSVQEAVYHILSLPMKKLSRAVRFVDTNCKETRVGVLWVQASLDQLDDNDTNVFQKSLLDRYQHRPIELVDMCLADFAAW